MLPIKLELPDGFLDEEVRCGYTVSAEMKKLWPVELDLLAERYVLGRGGRSPRAARQFVDGLLAKS